MQRRSARATADVPSPFAYPRRRSGAYVSLLPPHGRSAHPVCRATMARLAIPALFSGWQTSALGMEAELPWLGGLLRPMDHDCGQHPARCLYHLASVLPIPCTSRSGKTSLEPLIWPPSRTPNLGLNHLRYGSELARRLQYAAIVASHVGMHASGSDAKLIPEKRLMPPELPHVCQEHEPPPGGQDTMRSNRFCPRQFDVRHD